MTEEKIGYVYCFSNACMPGILKIGMTECVEQRLREANSSDTFKPPVEYKIEYAKRVVNHRDKEKLLHKQLQDLGYRINESREFFRVSVEEAKEYFDSIEGEYIEIIHKEKVKRIKSVVNEFICERCGTEFTQKHNVIKHLKRKTPCEATEKDISIEDCLAKLEVKIEKLVSCEYCSKELSCKKSLWRHKQTCQVKAEKDK